MMEQEGRRKRVISFVDAYQKLKWKRAVRVLNQEGSSIYNVSFENGKLRKWVHKNRRVGRPRFKWVTETIKDMWHNIRHEHAHISQAFDGDNSLQHEAIKQSIDSLASDPSFLFKTP